MHRAAFAACGLTGWQYQRLPVPPALFAETARALGPAGFLGANVTIPHKPAALAVADKASAAARAIGAANTLTFDDGGRISAENTDAPGLLAALPEPVAGATAVVMGAGGSARAAVWALREAGAERVWVWNRTAARARALAQDLGAQAIAAPRAADLLVNCTAVGLGDSATLDAALKQLRLSNDDLSQYRYVVDLVYRDGDTPLVRAAREQGALVVDGLEILVQQGALSFSLWTGQPPPVQAMRQAASDAAMPAEDQSDPGKPSQAGSDPRSRRRRG